MAHPAQILYINQIKRHFSQFFTKTKVIEIGSLNINGTVRFFFEEPERYIGCDLGAGSGVDIVCHAHKLKFPDGSFDVAVSCECFEHDMFWQETFQKMWDLVRPGGLVLFTCATEGRPEHGTTPNEPYASPFTNEYYKNLTTKDFEEVFNLPDMFSFYHFTINSIAHDLYFWGISK